MNYQLPSSLTQKNVLSCLRQIQESKTTEVVIIDGSKVNNIDSAGIALLLELQAGIPNLQFTNLSPPILQMADLYRISFPN